MAEKNNKICIICKTPYHYCPTCRADGNKPAWYAIFDGQNCHDIYDVCTQYRDGVIDKKTAYYKIKQCDISNIKNFADVTKSQIEEILSYVDTPVSPKVDDVKVNPSKNVRK